MILLGLLFLFTGLIMNVKVLRGPLRRSLTSQEIMRTPPFLVSSALIVIGFFLVAVGGH